MNIGHVTLSQAIFISRQLTTVPGLRRIQALYSIDRVQSCLSVSEMGICTGCQPLRRHNPTHTLACRWRIHYKAAQVFLLGRLTFSGLQRLIRGFYIPFLYLVKFRICQVLSTQAVRSCRRKITPSQGRKSSIILTKPF